MYNSVKKEIGKKPTPYFNPTDNFGSYKDKKQITNQKEGAKPKGFNFKNGAAKGKPKLKREPKEEDPGYTKLEILAAKAKPYGGPTIRNHR